MAVRLARRFKAELVLDHVFQPMAELAMAPRAHRLRRAIRAERLKVAVRRLTALEVVARKARVRAASVVVSGPPATSVLRQAKEADADLVVVGSRRKKGIACLLVGSVAEAIVRAGPIPVLVVPESRRA